MGCGHIGPDQRVFAAFMLGGFYLFLGDSPVKIFASRNKPRTAFTNSKTSNTDMLIKEPSIFITASQVLTGASNVP